MAYSSSEQQKELAKVAEDNAEYAAESAANKDEQEKLNRQSERKEQRKDHRRRKAIMEAGFAKSGVLLDGTPSNYLVAQSETDELNIQRADQVSQVERRNILYEGQLQANEYMNKAAAHKNAATAALIGGVVSMSGSFSSWGSEERSTEEADDAGGGDVGGGGGE